MEQVVSTGTQNTGCRGLSLLRYEALASTRLSRTTVPVHVPSGACLLLMAAGTLLVSIGTAVDGYIPKSARDKRGYITDICTG